MLAIRFFPTSEDNKVLETHNLAVSVNWEVLFRYYVFGIDASDIWGSDVG